MAREVLSAVVVAATALAPGCVREDPVLSWQPGAAGTPRLQIESPSSTLLVGPAGPGALQLEAYLAVHGRRQRVTDRVRWSSDRPGLARVDAGGRVTADGPFGGQVAIAASDGNENATAKLAVKVTLAYVEGATATAAALFSGDADPRRAPEILYPLEGAILPPNLPALEVHFRPGRGTTLHEIAFSSEVSDVRLYVRCQALADGCVQEVSGAPWRTVSESNRGGRLKVSVRSADDGGANGESPPRTLGFGADDLRGAFTYWTTAGRGAVMRWDTGDRAQTEPAKLLGPERAGDCLGCHSVSRDGNRMLVTTGEAGMPGQMLLYDLGTQVLRSLSGAKLQFGTFSPGGTLFVAVRGDAPTQGPKNLELFDGGTGAARGSIDLRGLRATHPDWSPDGDRIAFTAVDLGAPYVDQRPGLGAIAYIEWEGGHWSSPRTAVGSDAGRNYYMPSFAPDSHLIAYVESSCPAGMGDYHELCDAEGDPSARLWLGAIPQSPDQRPRPLDALNRPAPVDGGAEDLWTSSPHWHPAPFRGPDGNTLYWLTFSSARRYGLRVPPIGARKVPAFGALLWMAAIDPGALAQGKDPSVAPFVLPYQSLETSNHAGQWSGPGL
jgi:hypothetical protein